MRQRKGFVAKLCAVNRFPSRAVVHREIPTLRHEPRNDAMKRRVFKVQRFPRRRARSLAGAQSSKVFTSFRSSRRVEFDLDPTDRCLIHGNVEKNNDGTPVHARRHHARVTRSRSSYRIRASQYDEGDS